MTAEGAVFLSIPIVAMTLNRPFATRSISSSICCSVDDGEFRMVYVDKGIVESAAAEGWDGGGRRENREGEGAMKDKY